MVIMNWKEDIIGNVIEKIATGKTPPTANKEYFDGDINWYTPSDIVNNIALNGSSRTITQKAIEDKKAIIYEADTLLITCIGNIGRLGLTTKKSSSNQQITGLKFKPFIYPRFAFYYFLFMQSHLAQKANNAVVPILNNAGLKEIKIKYPDLKNQQEIAQILEQADKARQQRKAANALTDEFLQSSFLSLFGDPVKNEKGWDKLNGKEYSQNITVGVVVRPASYYVKKGVIALRSLNIRPDKINLNNLVYFSPEVNSRELSKSILKANDVVIVRTGATGTAAVVPYELEGCNCIDLIIVRPNHKIIQPKYLTFFFNSDFGKQLVLGKEVGGIQKHFNIGAINELKIPVPPLSLQQQFAGIVAQAEQLRQKQKESEQELENLFQGLLQKYFG